MRIIRSLRDEALPLRGTAVALGMFDGIHVGHQVVLRAALKAARADSLLPCVFTFALAEPPPSYKEAGSLTTQKTLAKLLGRMGFEYAVALPFEQVRGMTGPQFVRQVLADSLGARFVCCGYNFAFGKDRASGAEDLMALARPTGIVCRVVEEISADGERVSSSRIRAAVSGGDMLQASRLLGRLFSIDFEVVQGNRIGRTLGSPTINQPFPEGFAVPRYGVYATLATVDDVLYSGVTNVGTKPTIGTYTPLAETYIQGFSGNLYGREIGVAFLEFIRPEQKFDSIEQLRENILKDAETAARIAESYLGKGNAGCPI